MNKEVKEVRVRPVNIYGKGSLCRGNGKCKGPEAGVRGARWRSREEVCEAGEEKRGRGRQR